jgi:four helix bundle protein
MSLPHHSLIAWQRADDLFIDLHLLSRGFPAIERFELASQLRRAAFSVPANIAEGYGRHTTGEKLQFLQIACGSLAEVGYCLHAAKRLGYIEESVWRTQDVGPVARPHEVYGSQAPLNRVPQLPCYPQLPSYPATQPPSY